VSAKVVHDDKHIFNTFNSVYRDHYSEITNSTEKDINLLDYLFYGHLSEVVLRLVCVVVMNLLIVK